MLFSLFTKLLVATIALYASLYHIPGIHAQEEDIELPESIGTKDLYKVLGIKNSPTLSIKDIKKAYRKLAQIHHPDKV